MRTPAWVLGYHGCHRAIGEAVLAGQASLRVSENEWDWLGSGIYFWENNARRALDWAREASGRNETIREPFVIGAVIDLGNCLDLLEANSIRIVQRAHERLKHAMRAVHADLPNNRGLLPDRTIRRLDCAVINHVHALCAHEEKPPFDSVRAAFVEGPPVYEGAGFHDRTHIQICLRREEQIIGYFRVRDLDES